MRVSERARDGVGAGGGWGVVLKQEQPDTLHCQTGTQANTDIRKTAST